MPQFLSLEFSMRSLLLVAAAAAATPFSALHMKILLDIILRHLTAGVIFAGEIRAS